MVSPSKSASQDDSSERRSHSRFRGLISCFVSCQHLADPFVLMPCQRLSKSVSDESIPSGPVREFLHQGRRVVHQTRVLSDILGLAEAGFHLLSFALVLQDNRESSCPVSNPGFVKKKINLQPPQPLLNGASHLSLHTVALEYSLHLKSSIFFKSRL